MPQRLLPLLAHDHVTQYGVDNMKKLLMLPLIFVFFAVNAETQVKAEQSPLTIRNVTADKLRFEPTKHEKISITYSITNSAKTRLNVYDARDILVYTEDSIITLSQGEHQFNWNGTDYKGRPVPAEAYTYVIEATSSEQKLVRYDLSDATGGKTEKVDGFLYNDANDTLQYRVRKPVRIFLRAGLKNGPFLKTIVNGAIRQPGLIKEKWDGMDASKILSIVKHKDRLFYGDAWSFSRNTIFVINKDNSKPYQSKWISDLDRSKTRPKGNKPNNLNLHAYQNRESSRDVIVSLKVLGDLKQDKDQSYIVENTLPLQIDVPAEDAILLEQQRFEVVFFLNGKMVYENEISYLPYNWTWKPENVIEGTNYFSAFIVGFGGHYGVSTIKFQSSKNHTSSPTK